MGLDRLTGKIVGRGCIKGRGFGVASDIQLIVYRAAQSQVYARAGNPHAREREL